MKVSLLVLTFNEVVGCRAIMPRVDRSWCDQILFIDGGSTDGTIEWARENGYQIFVQDRPGIRRGYKQAWHLVEGDVVVTFSPDGNCIPEKIPELIEKMREGYDLVVASRYLGSATSDDDDLVTGFGNWLFTATANLLFRCRITDVLGIFRAYRKKLVSELGVDTDEGFAWVEKLFCLPPGDLSWDPLLSVRARKYGYGVGEIPGPEPARIGGERKLKVVRWGGAVYAQFLREFLRPADPAILRRAGGKR